MTNDRELLELAAFAAGIKINFDIFGASWIPEKSDYPNHREDWNPLKDDGDALRLAVKLKIKVLPYPIFSEEKHSVIASRRTFAPPEDDDNTYVGPEVIELYNGDPDMATRRAIVRAAAEIGKEKE